MKAIRQYRRAASLSISQLSKLSGVPRKTIARIEAGDYRWATLMQLKSVAKAMNLSVTVIPYFADRKPLKAFADLDESGKTGTDSTQSISEDRE